MSNSILGLHETSLLPDTYGTPALLLSQETSWVLIHVWLTISREPCSQTWEHGGRLPILYTTCAIIRWASGVGGRALSLPVARPRTSVARSHPITSQINLRTCLTLLCYRPWELYLLSLSLSLSTTPWCSFLRPPDLWFAQMSSGGSLLSALISRN